MADRLRDRHRVVLVGLIVSWIVAAVGAVIALVFGFLWIRDVTRDMTRAGPARRPSPSRRQSAAGARGRRRGRPAAAPEERGGRGLPAQHVFLEASTLGLGAVIGGLITLPVLGFAVLPSFTDQDSTDVDLGPLENFPEGQFVIATYLQRPEDGEVSRRTTFIRNNGLLEDRRASRSVLPLRAPRLPGAAERAGRRRGKKDVGKTVDDHAGSAGRLRLPVPRRPVRHRGQPHRRPARPRARPLRVLDPRRQPLSSASPSASAEVEGDGAEARI